MKRYFWNVAIAIDQFFNALTNGDPDETISSRMGKKLAKHEQCPFCNWVCKILNKIDKNHCQKSIEKDEGERM